VTNQQIAAIINEIADIMEIRGEDYFRVRSYRRGAESVQNAPFPITADTPQSEIQKLPGVGKSLAAKIAEIAATGTCKYREELLVDFPVGLLELLKVPGLGPKRVALLNRELGIVDLAGLEAAARAGALEGLPGLGKKSQQKILEGVQMLKRLAGRILLSEAREIADMILSALPDTVQAQPAGSLRRGKETIGDIDILAIGEGSAQAMEAFCSMPEVDEVLLSGETKSSVLLKSGVQADLRVVPEESFGAALQYFTGSKQHNVRLRARARERGWTVNEYGLFDEKEKRLAGADEAEIYEKLGLQWIPPELREDAGEIEAAERGELPDLLTLDDIRGDLHTHTDWSDGAQSIEEMALAARERGYEYIAITDHSRSLGVARGLDPERLMQQVEEIRRVNKAIRGITVLSGTEVDILADGSLDLPDDVLAELDIVIASVHSSLSQPQEVLTERILNAVRNPHVDVIGHLTGRLIGRREPGAVDVERVFDAAAQTQTAIELNAFPDRLDIADVNVRLAIAKGVPIAIGTDAHRAEHLELIKYGVTTARRGWAEAQHIVNTWPKERLLKWLRRER